MVVAALVVAVIGFWIISPIFLFLAVVFLFSENKLICKDCRYHWVKTKMNQRNH